MSDLFDMIRLAYTIDEVVDIKFKQTEFGIGVTIITSNTQYDDSLLERLLDIEFALRKDIRMDVLEFSYVPMICWHPNNRNT